MLFFPEEFFQDEERCGFVTPKKLKHIWAEELEVLSKADRICRKYGLKYFVFFGTLLGAIRHQGFVPWDDDLDICMMRADYEKFIEVLPKEEPTWLVRYSKIGDMRSEIHASVMNAKSMRADKEYLDEHHGCPFIVGFDIFPLDDVPDSETEFEAMNVIYGLLYRSYKAYEEYSETDELEENLKYIENFCNCTIDRSGDIKLQLWNLMIVFSTIYNGSDSKRVQFYAGLVSTLYKDKSWGIPKSFFDECEYVPFENIKVPVPKDYKYILERIYGDDYMTPIRREGHFFFQEQEELMKANENFWQHCPFNE